MKSKTIAVSFRLSRAEYNDLQAALKLRPRVGIRSVHQLARHATQHWLGESRRAAIERLDLRPVAVAGITRGQMVSYGGKAR